MIFSLGLRSKTCFFISVYCFPIFLVILHSCSYQVTVRHKALMENVLTHLKWDFLPNRVLHLMFASKISLFLICSFFPFYFLQCDCRAAIALPFISIILGQLCADHLSLLIFSFLPRPVQRQGFGILPHHSLGVSKGRGQLSPFEVFLNNGALIYPPIFC